MCQEINNIGSRHRVWQLQRGDPGWVRHASVFCCGSAASLLWPSADKHAQERLEAPGELSKRRASDGKPARIVPQRSEQCRAMALDRPAFLTRWFDTSSLKPVGTWASSTRRVGSVQPDSGYSKSGRFIRSATRRPRMLVARWLPLGSCRQVVTRVKTPIDRACASTVHQISGGLAPMSTDVMYTEKADVGIGHSDNLRRTTASCLVQVSLPSPLDARLPARWHSGRCNPKSRHPAARTG